MNQSGMETTWRLPPANLQLPWEAVHLWLGEVDSLFRVSGSLMDWLPAEELQRSRRFLVEGPRRQFLAGKLLLRKILSVYSSCHPAEISFAGALQGKPSLFHPAESGLEFNLSHSGNLVLAAVARDIPVGTDVEHHSNNVDYDLIARKYFSNSEYRLLQNLSGPDQMHAFYTVWTRKEAFIKGLGDGLSVPLQDFSVPIQGSGLLPAIEPAPGLEKCREWQLYGINVPRDYSAALAVKSKKALQISGWLADPIWLSGG